MTEKECRSIVAVRSLGRCEVCGRWNAAQMHHRQNRSQGGKWDACNIMHLCVECHGFVTEHPKTAAHHGWRVLSYETPSQKPVSICGQWFLLTDSGGRVSVPGSGMAS